MTKTHTQTITDSQTDNIVIHTDTHTHLQIVKVTDTHTKRQSHRSRLTHRLSDRHRQTERHTDTLLSVTKIDNVLQIPTIPFSSCGYPFGKLHTSLLNVLIVLWNLLCQCACLCVFVCVSLSMCLCVSISLYVWCVSVFAWVVNTEY